jgi:hypothetical protein
VDKAGPAAENGTPEIPGGSGLVGGGVSGWGGLSARLGPAVGHVGLPPTFAHVAGKRRVVGQVAGWERERT